MTLLRLAAFRPETPAAAGEAPRRVSPAAAPPVRSAAAAVAAAPAPPAVAAAPAPPAAAPVPASPQSPGAAGSVTAEVPDWRALIVELKLGGMVRELAQHCEWLGMADGVARLRLAPAHRALATRAAQEKLQNELSNRFGQPLKLQIDLGEPAAATPAQQLRSEQQERHNQAVQALEQDGFVRDMIDLFDASLNESSIKPL